MNNDKKGCCEHFYVVKLGHYFSDEKNPLMGNCKACSSTITLDEKYEFFGKENNKEVYRRKDFIEQLKIWE